MIDIRVWADQIQDLVNDFVADYGQDHDNNPTENPLTRPDETWWELFLDYKDATT